MEDFRKLKIWQNGMEITDLCFELCRSFPTWVDIGFKSQIYRSSSAIPSNISEGCGRSSLKSKVYFCEIALGSNFELDTQIEIVKRNKLTSRQDILDKLSILITEEGKMVHRFIIKLENRNVKDGGQIMANS